MGRRSRPARPKRSIFPCGGSWVPAPDFDTIVERVTASASPRASDALAPAGPTMGRAAEAVVYRRCPECGEIMHRRNFARSSGIVVDWCHAHGVWFDPDELHAVATFVRRGGLAARRMADEHRPTVTIPEQRQSPASSIADMLVALLS